MRRNEKRNAILDAAATLFGDLGFDRTSIDAVATAAKVSKPTVYSHFTNKDVLFRESVARSARIVNESSFAAMAALRLDDDWERSLRSAARSLSACQLSPCARALNRQIHAESLRDPLVYQLVCDTVSGPIEESLAGKLAILANAGYLTIPDPQLAATQFFALLFAEFPKLTSLGAKVISDDEAAAAVDRGLHAFLRIYTPTVRRVREPSGTTRP